MRLELELTDEMARRLEKASLHLALSNEDIAKMALSQYLGPPRKGLSEFFEQIAPIMMAVVQSVQASGRVPGQRSV